jgi:hypothetical protein
MSVVWTPNLLKNTVRTVYTVAWKKLWTQARRRVLIDSVTAPRKFRSQIAVISDIHRLMGSSETQVRAFQTAANNLFVELQFQRAAVQQIAKRPEQTLDQNTMLLVLLESKVPVIEFSPPKPGAETRIEQVNLRMAALLPTLPVANRTDIAKNLANLYRALLREQAAYSQRRIYLRETSEQISVFSSVLVKSSFAASKPANLVERLQTLPQLAEILAAASRL